MVTRLVITLALTVSLAACGDEKKRPLGESCGGDTECESGLCLQGQCLDPDGDEDLDGLTNQLEGSLGTNPLNPDTDYDGVMDGDELDGLAPRDTDADGLPDILESLVRDADQDCIPDELDAQNATPSADPRPAAAKLCRKRGVCAAFPGNIVLVCEGGVPRCEYDNIAQWQSEETTCDGLDNDCDGLTDEGSPDRDGDAMADCIDPDRDGDDSANEADNCPEIANADQADADNDGRGDACDAPEAPTVTSVTGSPTNTTTPLASGSAEPFATVSIATDPACATVVGSGAATASGAFSATLTLAEGKYDLFARAANRAGLTSSCVPTTLFITIDRTAPTSLGDPAAVTVSARSYDETSALFLIEGVLSEPGTIEVFTDDACATRAASATSDPRSAFAVDVQAVRGTTTAYAIVRDQAGNASGCLPLTRLFGRLSVTVNQGNDPVVGRAIQFHYPDGAPAGEPVLTNELGIAIVEGFSGFGATVAPAEGRTDLRSVLGLIVGDEVRFDDGVPAVATESFYYEVNVTWPQLPQGTSWLSLAAPCGDYYLSPDGGTLYFWSDCFLDPKYDAALVAYDAYNEPIAYIVQTGIDRPTRATTLAFEGAWKTTGWYENRFDVVTNGQGADWYFGVGLSTPQSALIGPSTNSRSGFVRPGGTATATTRLPPIPGVEAVWIFQTSHLLANGGRGGRAIRDLTAPPVVETIDLESDPLPRAYAFDLRFEDEKGTGLPTAMEWLADPGLGESDALVVEMTCVDYQSNAGAISWSLIARPSETARLAVPRFSLSFPGARSLAQVSYSYLQTVAWYDFAATDHFAGLLHECAFGSGCGEILYGAARMSFIGSNER